jgi:hypothetical protein
MLELVPSIFLLTCTAVCISAYMSGLTRNKERKPLFLIATSGLSIVLVCLGLWTKSDLFLFISFGIEIGICVFDLFQQPTPEVLVHHICTPTAICFSFFRPSISVSLLGILNGSICISNFVSSLCRLVHIRWRSLASKSNGLLTSFVCGLLFRIAAPGVIVSMILRDLWEDKERPDWARLYATSVLMLMYLNIQLVFTYFIAWRRSLSQGLKQL